MPTPTRRVKRTDADTAESTTPKKAPSKDSSPSPSGSPLTPRRSGRTSALQRRQQSFLQSPGAVSYDFLVSLWALIAVQLSYGWLLFNNWLYRRSGVQTKPTAVQKNKIVVIGDDTAFGYGDTLEMGGVPGITGQLRRALLVERYKLRQSWVIYNCGVCGTTSADWLPKSINPGINKTHFQKVFDDVLYAEADVVVLLVGSYDGRAGLTPDETLSNIQETCQTLREQGKDVWVCTIPTNGDVGKPDSVIAANLTRNERLVEWLETKPDGINAGPCLDAAHSEYRHKSFYTPDGQHFSAKGYRKIAKDLADLLPPSLIKREFARFSKHLKF
ncbi:hypothetical protein HKX48_003463 [Thoreauomyces humboldtii]|nr:hypothetical protein HKX48_003463 [Thoreauomyces humboldtii]